MVLLNLIERGCTIFTLGTVTIFWAQMALARLTLADIFLSSAWLSHGYLLDVACFDWDVVLTAYFLSRDSGKLLFIWRTGGRLLFECERSRVFERESIALDGLIALSVLYLEEMFPFDYYEV